MASLNTNISKALCLLSGLLVCGGIRADEVITDTHKFTEVRNNIWLAQTAAPVFNSNALVIVNDEDVVLVDSHVTPAKARELIKAIKALTPLPITALINSHFHWDHAHGNQEFGG